MKLLTRGKGSAKILKSDKAGKNYLSAIMYLAPASISGTNMCPKSSAGCRASCLFTSGHAGIFPHINVCRINRTKFYLSKRQEFKEQLFKEIDDFAKYCKKNKQQAAVRLNGTSDIVWERIMPEVFAKFPEVQFYDYTKIVRRLDKVLPTNYHLTFSRSENNEEECKQALKLGFNVAAVFNHKKPLPKKYLDNKVVDGDKDDLRFLNKGGVVIGLKAKGKARKDNTGFVIL